MVCKKKLALVDWASPSQAATARWTGEAEAVVGADCVQSTFPIAALLVEFVCEQFCTESKTRGVRGNPARLGSLLRCHLGFRTPSKWPPAAPHCP